MREYRFLSNKPELPQTDDEREIATLQARLAELDRRSGHQRYNEPPANAAALRLLIEQAEASRGVPTEPPSLSRLPHIQVISPNKRRSTEQAHIQVRSPSEDRLTLE